MVAIPRDKINYHKASKYANVLIFQKIYHKTKNVSYYLNISIAILFSSVRHCPSIYEVLADLFFHRSLRVLKNL